MTKRKSDRRSSHGYSKRKVGTRQLRQRFLIVCEGKKTEPQYFKKFKTPSIVVDIQGIGKNTVQIVQKAIELREKDDYDQTWCVMDRNSFPAQNFNAALQLATKEKIQIAYSNESFELWYLLHFNYFNTPVSRKNYSTKLSKLLGYKYKKNSDDIYEKLKSSQSKAVENATKLLKQYSPCNPEKDNPSTTVHLLVQELNKYIRP